MRKFFQNKFQRKNENDDVIIKALTKKHTSNHLIVDDVDYIREVLKFFLEEKELNVFEAENGGGAIDIINKEGINFFDVIWMDINMPLLDGIQTSTILRRKGYKNIIVMVTGNISHETLLKCKYSKVNSLFPKPILREKLFSLPYFSIYN